MAYKTHGHCSNPEGSYIPCQLMPKKSTGPNLEPSANTQMEATGPKTAGWRLSTRTCTASARQVSQDGFGAGLRPFRIGLVAAGATATPHSKKDGFEEAEEHANRKPERRG